MVRYESANHPPFVSRVRRRRRPGRYGRLSRFRRIEPTPYGIKLGIATYTFRNFDRAKAIEMLHQVHATWISIKDTDQQLSHKASLAETAAARREFDDAGFKVMSAGNVNMTQGKTVEELRPIFEWAKAARLPMMVCAPTHDNIRAVEALVKEYNIRIAIHNHGPEDKHFPTPQSVLEAVRPLDRRCGLCMDVGHTERAGVDPVKTIPEAGDRLFDMHVKDLAISPARSLRWMSATASLPSLNFSGSSIRWITRAA